MNRKIKVLWFVTPFQPRYGVMNIVKGWAENVDCENFEITLACFSTNREELVEQMSSYPYIKLIHLPDLAQFKGGYIRQAAALYKLFHNHSYDVIHTIFIQADIIGAACAKLFKIPVHVSSMMGQLISSVNGSAAAQRFKRKTYKFLFRNAGRNIQCFLPITRSTTNQLQAELGIEPKKVEVIYSGVPIDIREKNNANGRPFTIGAASQLIPEKGVDILIRALPEIHSFIPGARIVIAGEGNAKERLEELANELQVREYVHFIGFGTDMPAFFASLDLFVFPARPSYDGLPRVILEAMVQRTPVVASNTTEISEVIYLDRINGWTFEVGNPVALSEAIKKMYNDTEERNKIIENAFQTAVNISVPRNMEKIQSVYRELLRQTIKR